MGNFSNKIKNLITKDLFSFYALTFFLSLFFLSLFYDRRFTLITSVLMLAAGVFLFIGFIHLHKMPVHRLYGFMEHYHVIIACLIGAVLTYFLSVNLRLGPVLGASIVGVSSYYVCHFSKITIDLPPAIYCGAFVGMVSPLIFPNFIFIGISGTLCGVLYFLSHDSYTGIGGKLGTIAFSSVVTSYILFKAVGLL